MRKGKKKLVSIEADARSVRRNTSIRHALLHAVAVTGVISVALLAPNALRVVKMFDRGKARQMNPKYLFASTFSKLLQKGLLVFENSKSGRRVRLTEIGKWELARLAARNPATQKKERWDKRWRMVIYDISEKRKSTRVRLKSFLRDSGFYKLQNSVWVYPYDSEVLIMLLKADFKIGKEVLYVVVEKIENDAPLKEFFDLE